MPNKADRSELEELEFKLMAALAELKNELLGKIWAKDELQKRFIQINKKLKDIFEQLAQFT